MTKITQIYFAVFTAAGSLVFVPSVPCAAALTLLESSSSSNSDNSSAGAENTKAAASGKLEVQPVVRRADQYEDYVNRWFGPWYLEVTVYPEKQYSSFGPSPKAHVQITGHSKNSLTKWTIETYGRTLNLKTVNGIPPKVTSVDEMDEFPATDTAVVEALERDTAALDPDARGDLAQYDADLLSAVSAMREIVRKLYGKISGPSTCLPPRCFN